MRATTAVGQLASLAQQTRLEIFRLLVRAGPDGMAAGKISRRLRVLPATLSFHLAELARSGLVKSRQQGRYIIYSTDFAAMEGLLGFLAEDCCGGAVRCAVPACRPVRHVPRRGRKAAAQ